jgi:hypothetical protein
VISISDRGCGRANHLGEPGHGDGMFREEIAELHWVGYLRFAQLIRKATERDECFSTVT